MRVSMTKARVLQALREQPVFTQGGWCNPSREGVAATYGVGGSNGPIRIKDDPGCKVCAVGAVVRHVLDPDTTLREVDITCSDETAMGDPVEGSYRTLLKHRMYLTALSAYFEQMPVGALSQETVRRRLLRFVTKHFPAKIVVDINGYGHRQGVRGIRVVP